MSEAFGAKRDLKRSLFCLPPLVDDLASASEFGLRLYHSGLSNSSKTCRSSWIRKGMSRKLKAVSSSL